MFKAKSILFPTDFSDCSRSVLDYVLSFAAANNCTLHFLYVLEYEGMSRVAESPKSEAIDPARNAQLEDELKAMAAGRKDADKVKIEYMVLQGHPVNEILRAVDMVSADMIVMATHGRTGFEQILIGSVAEKVVRHAECPVLTIKPPKEMMKRPE